MSAKLCFDIVRCILRGILNFELTWWFNCLILNIGSEISDLATTIPLERPTWTKFHWHEMIEMYRGYRIKCTWFFENWLEPNKSQCANPQSCLQCVWNSHTTKSRFHTILSYLQLQYFFFNSFFGSATCPNIDCEWQPNWQSPHSVFTDISHRLSDFVSIHVWMFPNLFLTGFIKIGNRVRLFRKENTTYTAP